MRSTMSAANQAPEPLLDENSDRFVLYVIVSGLFYARVLVSVYLSVCPAFVSRCPWPALL
jgi:hypothetical protein